LHKYKRFCIMLKKCSCKFAAKTYKKLLGLKSDVYGYCLLCLINLPEYHWLCDELLLFFYCKLLWIKASAKCVNVIVTTMDLFPPKLVHPKIWIISSFINPQVVPNQSRSFFVLLNTKEVILKNMGNQPVELMDQIDFHNMWKKILWQSMGIINCWLQTFLSFLC